MTKTSKIKLPRGIEHVSTLDGISEYKLNNGMKVLLKEVKSTPLFSWQVWYRVGSRNENTGLTGLAHFLEHMMFKGTKEFEKGEVSQLIQLNGGVFNAFTSDDYTGYYENFSPEHLELAIKIEAERMRNSKLDKDEIELERTVIYSELEGGENNPHNLLYKNLKATAYHSHPYKNPIIGWDADLKNIGKDSMKDFYDTYYQPGNATAVLLGNFNTELALELIDKYFGSYKSSKKKIPAVSKEPKQSGLRKSIIRKEGLVTLLGMGFHIPEFSHPDYPALSVLSDVLFGGTSSRTYKSLVDSGLLLDINGYAEAGVDPGLLRIMANLSPGTNIEDIEYMLDKELEAIKKGITVDELERAKARVEASSIYERDGVHHEAMQIAYFDNMGDWKDYVNWVEKINAVDLENLKRVANGYLTESNKTVVYLLPEEPKSSLFISSKDSLQELKISEASEKVMQGYGAGQVEALDPKKLNRLFDLSEPKYSKKYLEENPPGLDFELVSKDYDKGIELYFKEDHNLPLIYAELILFAGRVSDPKDKFGLSYLTAEMLERGTKKHDKFKLSDLLDRYGAEISFSSKKETATVHFSVVRKHFDKVLELFKENLYEPLFDKAELEKLKQETIGMIKQEDEYLSTVANRELHRILYPEDHPYYMRSPEEKIKAVESITVKDIKDFYAKHYGPHNLKLSVVGDTDLGEIESKIIPVLEAWSKEKHVEPEISRVEFVKPTLKEIDYPNKRQVELTMGHRGEIDRSHPDFYAFLLANHILGGSSLSSRLGTVVRDEHGLVYDIRSSLRASLGAGAYSISLGCNPENVSKAIELTKKTVKEFLDKGVNESELKSAKSYLAGSFSARYLSSNEEIAQTLSSMILYDLEPEYIENYSEMINSISLEDVNRAARKYIDPDKFSTVVVGPINNDSSKEVKDESSKAK